MDRGFVNNKGLEYFKCENCPERNKQSKKKGQFKVRRYLHIIELECPYCHTKYIIPIKNVCHHCNKEGETIIYTKEEFAKIKKPSTI